MSDYQYTRVDRDDVEDVVLHSVASQEACTYRHEVQDLDETYRPRLKEAWESGDREFWREVFDEREYEAFAEYVEQCIEDPDRFHPFTIRQTERHVEQQCRDSIDELAPKPAGRYTVNDVARARSSLPAVPAAPPGCRIPTQFEWVCRLLATLHYDCPRLPSALQIHYRDPETTPTFKFADFVTTIRSGRVAVVEITMRSKQFDQKIDQLDDYCWLLELATGVRPEAYLVQLGLVTERMREGLPEWCTGYYSIQGFDQFLAETAERNDRH